MGRKGTEVLNNIVLNENLWLEVKPAQQQRMF